jgi:predicted dinucleotide-utilizing enzyme
VAVCVVKTDFTLGENDALVWFSATVTVAGTVTAALLLERLTVTLLVDAAASLARHVIDPAPLIWEVQ